MHGLKRDCQLFQRSEASDESVLVVEPSFAHNEIADKFAEKSSDNVFIVIIECDLVRNFSLHELITFLFYKDCIPKPLLEMVQ